MNDQPTVSVLLPVYNAERYLREAVESVLAQTFTDFELLVVDDGSTDGSLAILREFERRDPRVRVISRPNTGYVVALNEMLGLAKGEFIARMDADDVCLPGRFGAQVDYLGDHPGVVCVGGGVQLIDGRGRFFITLSATRGDTAIQKEALRGSSPICHPAAMIRRGAIRKVGGYDASTCPAEDLDLWLRLGELGQLDNLEMPVLKYRLYGESVSDHRHAEQLTRMADIVASARVRRGLEPQAIVVGPFRPGPSRRSRYDFTVKHGWFAFQSGERRTALIYGLKGLLLLPSGAAAWRLVAVTVLKQYLQVRVR